MGPVILIYPKTNPFPHSISTPLSIFCLGSYLEQHGVDVEYFDERIHKKRDLFAPFNKTSPMLIGISSMTGYQIKRGLELCKLIRKYNPGVPVVWGGIHPSMQPEQTLSSEYVDFVIKGEGEATLLELCKNLADGGKDFSAVNGLLWKKNGSPVVNKERKFLDVDKLPFPYSGKALKLLINEYLHLSASRPVVGYQITRGCQYRCKFCYNMFYNNSVARTMDIQKYSRELKKLKEIGVDKIYFYDNNLGPTKEPLLEFSDVIGRLNMRWCGNMRVNVIDEELLHAIEKAGCEYLFIGLEAITDEQLRRLGKDQTLVQIESCIKALAQWRLDTKGINKTYSFMCGLPNEDQGYIYRLMDFVDWIRKIDPRAGITLQSYAPLPGTPLYEEALNYGFTPPKKLGDWWDFTTGEVVGPWVKNKNFLRNIFLISFLAFRYDKFLNRTYYPFHFIARLRWKIRFFGLCYERILFGFMKTCCLIIDKWFN